MLSRIRNLEFYAEGGSEKHLADIRSIRNSSAQTINFPFLEKEIAARGLEGLWRRTV